MAWVLCSAVQIRLPLSLNRGFKHSLGASAIRTDRKRLVPAPPAVNSGRNLRQTDRSELLNLVKDRIVTGPGGGRFGPGGFVVNCPIISSD